MTEVLIEIKTTIEQYGKSILKQTNKGIFISKEMKNYLKYTEEMGAKVVFKFSKDKVTLTRFDKGSNLKLEFEKDKENTVYYKTDFGVMELNLKTKKLFFEIHDDCGELLVNYELFSKQECIGKYEIKLHFYS